MQTNEQLLSAIENYLAQTEFPAEPELLYAPIGYSLAGGGKRLRPMLLMLSNGIFTDKIQHALPAAAAVEVFHNFTLLHDDIMDNAAVRRGKPSVYAKWGQMQFAEAAVIPSLGNEFYATLMAVDQQNRAVFRLSSNPLVNWLWIGGILMCLLPFISFRRRNGRES